ncbi:DUF4817 domain-containing protein [Trichonephila clavipes]|nr:DUF4817 domain-containing protein [Trichonephila clavipes]
MKEQLKQFCLLACVRETYATPLSGRSRTSKKMATSKQKAFCVIQFEKTESAITVQRAFSIKFGCQPPNNNNIHGLYNQFETNGCLCTGKKYETTQAVTVSAYLMLYSYDYFLNSKKVNKVTLFGRKMGHLLTGISLYAIG